MKLKRVLGFLTGFIAVFILCFFVFISGFHAGSLNEGRKQRNLMQERIEKLEKDVQSRKEDMLKKYFPKERLIKKKTEKIIYI